MWNINKISICISLLVLTACQPKETSKVNAISQSQIDKLSFTCTHEVNHLPPLDPQADLWFKQGRAMEKASGPKDYAAIGVLYRQAAAKDHYKALRNLQNLIRTDLVSPLPDKTAPEEVIEIVEHMIRLNIPAGYYAMGLYLERGYGLEQDKMASLSYYRKAADLGNPEGQYVIGDLLTSGRLLSGETNPAYRPEIGKSILDCSANQGNAEAARRLSGYYKEEEQNYPMAVKYLQLAVKNGNEVAPRWLGDAFDGPTPSNELDYFGLAQDTERVRRYRLISNERQHHELATFPDIDKIVPLPPAPLPDWDGTFEYKKQSSGE